MKRALITISLGTYRAGSADNIAGTGRTHPGGAGRAAAVAYPGTVQPQRAHRVG